MFRRISTPFSATGAGASLPSPSSVSAAAASLAPTTMLCWTSKRELKVRKEKFFSEEGISHARRVSWAPHTTPKKQGVFAKLARSNFYDRRSVPYAKEPYTDEGIEAHRTYERPDVYIYKYNISPTHMSLRD